MARIITLVGGESTGKSTLSCQLVEHLSKHHGLRCALVDEYLRAWCQRMGRSPLPDEQATLARQQAERIAEAADRQSTDLVVADTTALVVASYSQLYFSDSSLLPQALEWQRGYDLTLLMGLDLPWVADGLFRESPRVRAATDQLLRQALQSARLPFQTVYGTGPQRLQQALRSTGHLLRLPLAEPLPQCSAGQMVWTCERCSDPACERRLFSRLLMSPQM